MIIIKTYRNRAIMIYFGRIFTYNMFIFANILKFVSYINAYEENISQNKSKLDIPQFCGTVHAWLRL